MSSEQVRVGIVGLGRSGWDIHAAGLRDLPDQFRVVADPPAERRQEAANEVGATAYADPQHLIADDKVELVVVATPSNTHVPLGLVALHAGKHVVLEKPMAETVAEIDLLTVVADEVDRVVTCFQNNRFEPSLLKVREIIESGRIGEVVLVRRAIHRFGRRADWQTLRSLGGGELSNNVSHYLDQLLLLIGDSPASVFADLRRTVLAGDAEDHVKLVLRPEKGPFGRDRVQRNGRLPATPMVGRRHRRRHRRLCLRASSALVRPDLAARIGGQPGSRRGSALRPPRQDRLVGGDDPDPTAG